MIDLDTPVKLFIDHNWLSIGIFLMILRSIARQFNIHLLRKLYLVLNNAFEFIRPSSKGTPTDTEEKN